MPIKKKEYTWVLWGIHPQKFAIFAECEKFTKICPCGAMDTRLRGYDESVRMGRDVRV